MRAWLGCMPLERHAGAGLRVSSIDYRVADRRAGTVKRPPAPQA